MRHKPLHRAAYVAAIDQILGGRTVYDPEGILR